MPLDEFRFSVLRTLMRLRSPASHFAGGSVLQRHAFRVSDDQDIFHASGENIVGIAMRDVEALRKAAFDVSVYRPHEGLVEAVVVQEDRGSTKIQWVDSGSWAFFKPVPDSIFGWRLHMADLAINKVLAAGGRRKARDYVDLMLVHRHVMPLWLAIWAAPGKNDSWSPVSLIEKIAMTNNFRQEEFDEGVFCTIKVSAADVGSTVRAALEEAREIFQRLPDRHAGKLFVDPIGSLVVDVDDIVAFRADIRAIEAERGGTWPSGPDIDHALVQSVIDAFGREGCDATNSRDLGQGMRP